MTPDARLTEVHRLAVLGGQAAGTLDRITEHPDLASDSALLDELRSELAGPA